MTILKMQQMTLEGIVEVINEDKSDVFELSREMFIALKDQWDEFSNELREREWYFLDGVIVKGRINYLDLLRKQINNISMNLDRTQRYYEWKDKYVEKAIDLLDNAYDSLMCAAI